MSPIPAPSAAPLPAPGSAAGTKTAAVKWAAVLEMLWSRSRFASYFYQTVALAANEGVPTLALTESRQRLVLYYQPAFVRQTPAEELLGLLIHEMLHVVLNHEHRTRPGMDPHLCNLAQDMVINSYLKAHQRTFFARQGAGARASLVLPPGLPEIPPALGKKPGRAGLDEVTWEEVYAWLQARSEARTPPVGEGLESETPLTGGEPWTIENPDPDDPRPAEGLRLVDGRGTPLPTGIHLFGSSDRNRRCRTKAERLLDFVQQRGEGAEERLFADLRSLIQAPLPARSRQWKQAVRSMADQVMPSSRWDYALSRPNRRFVDAGIYAPGRYRKHKPLVTIVVDVSGSMAATPGEIEAAFGAVEELLEDYRINLLCLDQDLFVPCKSGRPARLTGRAGHFFYQKGDWRYIQTGSRGATFFAPLFNDYLRHHGETLLVMTDGEIYDLDALRPYFPTLWLITGKRSGSFRPPFGRVMAL
ncbi:MAG: DUF2201 family putative metallopeptidase [Desulfosudaceae bacterium]